MRFAELVDIAMLRDLCQHFTDFTGAVTAVLELDGEVLVATGWQDICTRFHRVNSDTAQRCLESDTTIAGQLRCGETYNVYRCRNGLVDVAVPIRVQGEHVANLFTGQFLFSRPDKDFFARQAAEFGFDAADYLEALSRVPVFREEHVRKMMGFLARLAEVIGELGRARLQTNAANQALREQESRLEQLVRDRTVELSVAKESAESASRAKSKFLATVSHELRTPLNAVIGFSQVALSGMSGPLNDEQQQQIGRVHRAGQHLLGLVTDILTVADESGVRVSPRAIDLREELEPVMASFASQAERRRLQFLCDWPDERVALVADPSALRRVLSHLLNNALKFTEHGSVELRVRPSPSEVTIEIHDTGVGIAAARVATLFVPFDAHLRAAGTPRTEGAGLGLAIVRELVLAMGGTIEVRSDLGAGSCFQVVLPRGNQACQHRLAPVERT